MLCGFDFMVHSVLKDRSLRLKRSYAVRQTIHKREGSALVRQCLNFLGVMNSGIRSRASATFASDMTVWSLTSLWFVPTKRACLEMTATGNHAAK